MLQYTNHARKRMRQRSITEAEIEYCLNNYDVSHADKKGNPIYRSTTPNGRSIKVVVAKDNPDKIITVGD
jgi:hypothetical protein